MRLREIETLVLALKVRGLTDKQIGFEIGRTEIAARSLRLKALRKLRHPAYRSSEAGKEKAGTLGEGNP